VKLTVTVEMCVAKMDRNKFRKIKQFEIQISECAVIQRINYMIRYDRRV